MKSVDKVLGAQSNGEKIVVTTLGVSQKRRGFCTGTAIKKLAPYPGWPLQPTRRAKLQLISDKCFVTVTCNVFTKTKQTKPLQILRD